MTAEEGELCERDLSKLADFLCPDTWKDFGLSLRLTVVQLRDIEIQHPNGPPKEVRFQMLLLWFRQSPGGDLGWDMLRKAAEETSIMRMVEYIDKKRGLL